MINTFQNDLYASMFLWTQYGVQQYAQAFKTVTFPLYYVPDQSLPAGYIGYSSPFKSWVYDSGVSGAYITQTVSGGGFSSSLTRSSGMLIDYENGRVILPSSFGTNLALTGTFSFSEVSIYMPNETDQQILTQTQFYLNPLYNGQATGGAPPYTFSTPAIFVNTLKATSQAFTFGGLNDYTTTYSLVVYALSNFQLNAILSIFEDAKYKNVPMLSVGLGPLNQFNDTPSGYNYVTYLNRYGTPGNLIYIKDVHTSKVSDRVKMNPKYFVGLVDLDVSYVRQPPA